MVWLRFVLPLQCCWLLFSSQPGCFHFFCLKFQRHSFIFSDLLKSQTHSWSPGFVCYETAALSFRKLLPPRLSSPPIFAPLCDQTGWASCFPRRLPGPWGRRRGASPQSPRANWGLFFSPDLGGMGPVFLGSGMCLSPHSAMFCPGSHCSPRGIVPF